MEKCIGSFKSDHIDKPAHGLPRPEIKAHDGPCIFWKFIDKVYLLFRHIQTL